MRWKIAIAGFLIICVAAFIALNRRPEPPIQVTGELSNLEVGEIRLALRRHLRPPIFGHLSWQDLKAAPGRIRDRFTRPYPEFQTIERRTAGFAVVIGHRPSREPSDKYLYYCAFKTTNVWWVLGESEFDKK